MASLIEFKTFPKNQRLLYKVTNGGLSFWVKSPCHAVVGLTETSDGKCVYELIIERRNCQLLNGYNEIKSVHVSSLKNINYILSDTEFRKFWIIWKNNNIVFGTGSTVILYSKVLPHMKLLNYITFYVHNDNRGGAEWRCYLPPVIHNLPLKPIQGGEPQWVQTDEQLPDGAMIGGYENEHIYIIRAPFRGSLTPGKFVPSLGLGFISWGGESHECDIQEVLCGYNCIWVPSENGMVPLGALEAGFVESTMETMYVGRAHHKGHLIVGKIAPSHKCCYFPYEDRELSAKYYEVLVVPNSKEKLPIVATDIDYD